MKDFLDHSLKWNSLGVKTKFGKIKKEDGCTKHVYSYLDPLKVDVKKSLDESYNLLAIDITDSNMFCVDVDNIDDSVKNFNTLLKNNNSTIDQFFYEESLNGGYHIYFNSNEKIFNVMGQWFEEIRMDLIFKDNIFTSPTYFNKKTYTFGSRSIFDINQLADFGEMPEWFDDFLNT